MIMHWITFSWRIARANPIFTFIITASLSIGCAVAFLVGVYLYDELTFERWLSASDRILRVETSVTIAGQETQLIAATFGGLAPQLSRVPGIEAQARIVQQWNSVEVGPDTYNVPTEFVDESFFDVFELEFIEGHATDALMRPDSIVLTESLRERFFGTEAALGQTLQLSDSVSVVTGVVRDLPNATHATWAMFAPLDHPDFRSRTPIDQSFTSSNTRHYIRAGSNAAFNNLKNNLPALASAAYFDNATPDQNTTISFAVTPIRDIHLRSAARSWYDKPPANVAQLTLFATVALALLGVSGFNFVMLSMARAVQRGREVGLRKAVGAGRWHLLQQYLAEAAVFTLGSVALGYAAAELSLPWFAELIGRELATETLRDPTFIGLAVAMTLIGTMLVAFYPALVLANARPSQALAGRSRAGTGTGVVSTALIIIQFAAVISLLASIFIMSAQANYIAQRPLGFEQANRLVLLGAARGPAETVARLETFRNMLRDAPGVVGISALDALPNWESNAFGTIVATGAAETDGLRSFILSVDLHFYETMDIPVIAGRGFSFERGEDRYFYDNPDGDAPDLIPAMVSVATLPALGVSTPEAAIGETFDLATGGVRQAFQVVGVTEDLHYQSPRSALEPVVFVPVPGETNLYVVQFDPALRESAITAVDQAWAAAYPDQAVSRSYFDDQMRQMYEEDRRLLGLTTIVSLLAVAIACLGLYGLASFSAVRRTKEVGVRKALGATQLDILKLLVWQFCRPVLFANLIAWPLAYFFMRDWLNSFTYRIEIGPVAFVLASGAALLIAVLAVGLKAVAVARWRPTEALRYE